MMILHEHCFNRIPFIPTLDLDMHRTKSPEEWVHDLTQTTYNSHLSFQGLHLTSLTKLKAPV